MHDDPNSQININSIYCIAIFKDVINV
jgi:hypothetical protein